MLRSVLISLLVVVSASGIYASSSAASDYPARPVKIIGQSAAGSTLDVLTRITAEELTEYWGRHVIVENRVGSIGLFAAQATIRAPADGFTLLGAGASLFTILPVRHKDPSFDVNRDLEPVAHLGDIPLLIAVSKSLGVNSLEDLIALAKAEPTKLNIGTNAAGSFSHLVASLLVERAEAPMLVVPYTGGAPITLADILGGRVHVTIEGISGVLGALQSGDLKALAVTSRERLPNFPDIPTVAETLPSFAAVGWSILAAPAATPPALLDKINADLSQVLARQAVNQRFQMLGAYVRPLSRAALVDFIRAEQELWWPQVRAFDAERPTKQR